jgi:hypothetical protein
MSRIFLVVLCLLLATLSGCPSFSDAKIEIQPVNQDPEGDLHFTDVAVREGKLDHEYEARGEQEYPAGTPCILLTGKIVNSSDRDWWISYAATGYGKDNNSIARTLDTGPITGVARTFIPAQSSEYFTLHLNKANNIVLFMVTSQKSGIMPP